MDTRLSCQGTISLPVANILKLQRQQANRTGRENEGSRQCRPRCHGRKIRGKPLPLSSFCPVMEYARQINMCKTGSIYQHTPASNTKITVHSIYVVQLSSPTKFLVLLRWTDKILHQLVKHCNEWDIHRITQILTVKWGQIGSSPQLVQLMAYKIENGQNHLDSSKRLHGPTVTHPTLLQFFPSFSAKKSQGPQPSCIEFLLVLVVPESQNH